MKFFKNGPEHKVKNITRLKKTFKVYIRNLKDSKTKIF